MADWWTEDNIKSVITDRINPDERLEHCFQAFSFGPGFYGLAALIGIFTLLFKSPDRYIFAMTNAAVYFVKHTGQMRVKEVLEVLRFPFSDIIIKAKGGIQFNVVHFQGADGWKAKMEFPRGRKYKPCSTLSYYKQIVEKLQSRCQPIGK